MSGYKIVQAVAPVIIFAPKIQREVNIFGGQSGGLGQKFSVGSRGGAPVGGLGDDVPQKQSPGS